MRTSWFSTVLWGCGQVATGEHTEAESRQEVMLVRKADILGRFNPLVLDGELLTLQKNEEVFAPSKVSGN